MELIQSINNLSARYTDCQIVLKENELICEQFQKVEHLFILLEGRVDYYSVSKATSASHLVSRIDLANMPIGWNGLLTPARFINRIQVSSSTARLLKIDINEIRALILDQCNVELLRAIIEMIACQYRLTIIKQAGISQTTGLNAIGQREEFEVMDMTVTKVALRLMKRSPFFEMLDDKYLNRLANYSEHRLYYAGETIYDQDSETAGIFIIMQGEVSLRRRVADKVLAVRTISTPSFVFGWPGLIDLPEVCAAVAVHDTLVYFIPTSKIEAIGQDHPDFLLQFHLRLLWLVGNQLQIAYSHLVRTKSGFDEFAVQNLIQSNQARLSIKSRLHLVPHLLDKPHTTPLAFELLDMLNQSGEPLEKHLASMSLDLLKRTRKEWLFVEGLTDIYHAVTEDSSSNKRDIQRNCAFAVKKLFTNANYQIAGWENLPKQSGNIFIYNHLLNDPYYTLANNFQITLDSHFISSLILDEYYGNPGMRIVRVGLGGEYGHQEYYDRLGFINVYTKDSPQKTKDQRKLTRDLFYKLASECLDNKQNLIISPEGQSFTTEESPGDFKLGAFKLALKQIKEPLIVPIVLAHFDKRITTHKLKCRIMPPIRLSKELMTSGKTIDVYVNDLNQMYRDEIAKLNEE